MQRENAVALGIPALLGLFRLFLGGSSNDLPARVSDFNPPKMEKYDYIIGESFLHFLPPTRCMRLMVSAHTKSHYTAA